MEQVSCRGLFSGWVPIWMAICRAGSKSRKLRRGELFDEGSLGGEMLHCLRTGNGGSAVLKSIEPGPVLEWKRGIESPRD